MQSYERWKGYQNEDPILTWLCCFVKKRLTFYTNGLSYSDFVSGYLVKKAIWYIFYFTSVKNPLLFLVLSCMDNFKQHESVNLTCNILMNYWSKLRSYRSYILNVYLLTKLRWHMFLKHMIVQLGPATHLKRNSS